MWPLLVGALALEVVLALSVATRPTMVAAAVIAAVALCAAVLRSDLLVIPVLLTLPLIPVYAAPAGRAVLARGVRLRAVAHRRGDRIRSALVGGRLR